MGRLARGHGLARLGQRSTLRHQAGPRGQLGRAACPDVRLEPAARQAVDRRHRAGGARAEFPVARTDRAACLAAACASPVLSAHPAWRAHGAGAGSAVRAERDAVRQVAGAMRGAAAVRHPRARLQLGDRRSDDDTLSRGDGRRGDQGRGARSRRSGARLGTAHRAWPGEARHRARPEAAAGGGCRPRPGGPLRRAGGELRHRRDGPAGAWRGGAAAAQSRPAVRLGIRPRSHRAGVACRRLRHSAAMLRRVRRAEPASRHPAARRLRLARSDVRADAGLRRGRRDLAAAAQRRRGADRLLDDRSDAVDAGRAVDGDAMRCPAAAAGQPVARPRAARRVALRRR